MTKPQPISVERPDASIEELIASSFVEDLVFAAKHSALNEDFALAILRRRDSHSTVVEAIARNPSVINHRKVLIRVIEHQHTQRHASLPSLRLLFTFELTLSALAQACSAHIKL